MGTPTTRKSIATIHAALGAGITMLDTGDSELIHGEPECGLLLVTLQALLSSLSRICRSRMGSTVNFGFDNCAFAVQRRVLQNISLQ